MLPLRAFLSLPALLLCPLFAANASPIGSIHQIFTFGDSLSDNGNAAIVLAKAGQSLSALDYAPNAFTDGPNTSPATAGPFGLWLDQFAPKIGVADPTPYLANLANTTNVNYAVASAQTGSANPQDIGEQLLAFDLTHLKGAPSNALYAFWGGANDVFNNPASGKTAADNLAGDIQGLAAGGAKYFMWFNLPLLGETPLGSLNKTAFNNGSLAFDQEWALDMAALNGAGINVIGVDVESLFNQIIASPATYGFNNVTSPAQHTTGNPNDSLFWDTEHPTTAGDTLIADLAYADLAAAPEPVSISLAALGLAGVLILRRRNRISC